MYPSGPSELSTAFTNLRLFLGEHCPIIEHGSTPLMTGNHVIVRLVSIHHILILIDECVYIRSACVLILSVMPGWGPTLRKSKPLAYTNTHSSDQPINCYSKQKHDHHWIDYLEHMINFLVLFYLPLVKRKLGKIFNKMCLHRSHS